MLFQGIAAAPGLAIAPCLKIHPVPTNKDPQIISREQAPAELERFTAAVAQASAQLESIAEAATGVFDGSGEWKLLDVQRTRFHGDRTEVEVD